MNAIKLVAETSDTVTISRADFEALLRAEEDVADLAAVETHRAHEARVGWDTAKAGYYTAEEAMALLDGTSPVKVWRRKRGMTQRALAAAADVSASYLAEIEAGKKPGSVDAVRRLAKTLNVPMECLVSDEQRLES